MPTIALVVNGYPRLSESFITNKVRLLADSGYDVTLIAHDLKADAMPPELAGRGRVLTAPSAHGIWRRILLVVWALLTNTAACIGLWRQTADTDFSRRLKALELYAPFAGKNFDIVHFAFSGLGISYIPIIPFLKKKSYIYVSCRGHAEQIRPLFDVKRKDLLRTLFDLTDRVHCVSEDIMNTCKVYGLEPTKVFINRPAIDPDLFIINNVNDSSKEIKGYVRIATIGRLHWKKSHETLLQSIKILIDKGVKVHLDIVGDGNEMQKLVFFTYILDIAAHVTFHGKKQNKDIIRILLGADIYVHVSISEGISNAVMEAMSMELPVISTDVGGMTELISSFYDGILIPALNPEAVADKIILLTGDSILRKELGQRARQKILKEFSLDRQRKVYLEEYSRQLTNND